MAKYRRAAEPEEEIIEPVEMQHVEAEPTGAEEETFKKRYGDLRRHTQQLLQQKDEELAKVSSQLETAAKGQIKFPKTDDTINISKPMLLNGKFAYYLLKDKDGCGYTSSPCTPFLLKKNIYQKKINGYNFYLIKKVNF